MRGGLADCCGPFGVSEASPGWGDGWRGGELCSRIQMKKKKNHVCFGWLKGKKNPQWKQDQNKKRNLPGSWCESADLDSQSGSHVFLKLQDLRKEPPAVSSIWEHWEDWEAERWLSGGRFSASSRQQCDQPHLSSHYLPVS